MEKINQGHPMSQSPDFVKDNIELLKSLFPTIVKEGKIVMEELEALLGEDVEKEDEHYNFTWAGKSMARREANKPSTATLRPDKSESKDWDTTRNIFIEGDNLEVLKLLQKSYANKVKMIYIDPPYNTGRDFIYEDDYSDNLSKYLSVTGQVDDTGKKSSSNSESDGRFHSNWLNMIYPRLRLARNLLSRDGLIFISIDDKEVVNLRKVCDELFGESNFIDSLIWKKRYGGGAKEKFYISLHEYTLVYAKDINSLDNFFIPLSEDSIKRYYTIKDNNLLKRGPYRTHPLEATKSMGERKNLVFDIPAPDGSLVKPKRQWLWSKERVLESLEKGELEFLKNKEGEWSVHTKQYLKEEDGQIRKGKPFSIIDDVYTQHGTNEIIKLFGNAQVFSFPKPTNFLKQLINVGIPEKNGILLDFFAGSGSSADALLQVNFEDDGERRFICVQIPEIIDSDSEAFKLGYKTISSISKERIRRSGDILKNQIDVNLFNENNPVKDLGFRAFKLDSSNLKTWDGNPDKLEETLFTSGKSIKDERGEQDVLFEILMKYGLDLTVPIEEKSVSGKMVYSVGYGTLFICLSDNITTEVAEAIGQWKEELEPPTIRVIFKDSGFNDVQKTNSIQILKRFGINEVNTI